MRRGRTLWLLLVGVLLFALGIALGQAIEDNETGGASVTYSRTVHVSPVAPTVTVTVTAP